MKKIKEFQLVIYEDILFVTLHITFIAGLTSHASFNPTTL